MKPNAFTDGSIMSQFKRCNALDVPLTAQRPSTWGLAAV